MKATQTNALVKAKAGYEGTKAMAAAGPAKQPLALPPDAAGQRKALKNIYIDKIGANVFAGQMRPFVGYAEDDAGQTARDGAEVFVRAIKESVQPRDAIEEMLCLQMAWTHARLAVLSSVKANQESIAALRGINDACDRCAGTFRKLMLALSEYRRPARSDGFTVVKQLNAAQQQVVANGQDPISGRGIASNEQGLPQALPAVAQGAGIVASDGPAQQAVAAEHRPQVGGRQGPLPAERHEAR